MATTTNQGGAPRCQGAADRSGLTRLCASAQRPTARSGICIAQLAQCLARLHGASCAVIRSALEHARGQTMSTHTQPTFEQIGEDWIGMLGGLAHDAQAHTGLGAP